MKRFFIFLLIALLVLTSCSTGKVKQEEPEVEVVTATPEKAPTAELPVPEPSVQPEAEEAEPTEETEQPQQPEAIIEVLPDEEMIVAEEPGPVDETTAEEIIQALTDQDWSTVITATAPSEEKPAAEEKAAEAVKPVETQSAETAKAEEAVQQPAQIAKPEQTAQTTQKPAEKKGPTSRIAAFLSKIGNFVMKEKLLSIGLLVCGVGVIYLIVALFISRHPKRPRRRHYEETSYQEGEEGYQEGDDASDDADAPVQEDVSAVEDDEFLRSLLGDDKK